MATTNTLAYYGTELITNVKCYNKGPGSWVNDSRQSKSLLKGKDNYGWPPCNNYFRSVAFQNKNIVSSLEPILMRRSTVLSLFRQLGFLGLHVQYVQGFTMCATSILMKPGTNGIRLFPPLFTNVRNKLECLSLASLSSLA